MQVGDPKKTAILAVVAVAAIGFCFKQLVGGGGEPKALRQAGNAAADAGGQTPAGGTLVAMQLDQLRVDPFSHAKLAPKNVVDPGPAAAPGSAATPNGGAAPFKPDFTLPGADPAPYQGPEIEKVKPDTWPGAVNPGNQPGMQIEKMTRVTLKAIVKVDQRMAFLAIDGEEARGYRAGDVIKNDLKVVFVNDDSVIVKSSKTTATLKVGQQGDL